MQIVQKFTMEPMLGSFEIIRAIIKLKFLIDNYKKIKATRDLK